MAEPKANTVKVKLTKPILGHGGAIAEVTLREPTVAEYLEIGDPFLVGMSPREKIAFALDDKVALASYARLLTIEPEWLLIEAQADWRDVRAIMTAVRGFFRDVAEADEDSATSLTNSSSAAVRTVKPSAGSA